MIYWEFWSATKLIWVIKERCLPLREWPWSWKIRCTDTLNFQPLKTGGFKQWSLISSNLSLKYKNQQLINTAVLQVAFLLTFSLILMLILNTLLSSHTKKTVFYGSLRSKILSWKILTMRVSNLCHSHHLRGLYKLLCKANRSIKNASVEEYFYRKITHNVVTSIQIMN